MFAKPVVATFDAEALTSDGGLLLIGAVDRKTMLTARLCSVFCDERQEGKVVHSLFDLLRQRIYAIAAGYADGNDAKALRSDPAFKMLCDRDPLSGSDLASQPTLSRFEHSLTGRQVVAMGREFERHRIEAFAARAPKGRRAVIDLDGTEDPAHGQQSFAFFNGFYDSYCFLPLVGFLSIDGESEQHLFYARLRPGVKSSGRGVIPLLRRTVARLRTLRPHTKILVRLDAGFVTPLLLDVLEELKVDYVLGLPANIVVLRRSKPFLRGLRRSVRKSGNSERRYGVLSYAAKTWSHERRVVVKAEVLAPPPNDPKRAIKTNVRFVVTNLRAGPQHVYESVYCVRGDSENRIKELKGDLEMDRTSCTSFTANQVRVLMTAAAYALFQEMRLELKGTELADAQVGTLRLRLLKIAARVVESVRRVVFHLPRSCASASDWSRLAARLGAATG
ncbi:MAG: IS1380 family transposase [Chloroflexota bacterium]